MKQFSTIFLMIFCTIITMGNAAPVINESPILKVSNSLLSGDTIALPFTDEFTSGILVSQGWEVENDNWHINTQSGNILPCAEFHPANALTNYEETLTSPWIDGNSVTDCRIYVDFDLRLTDALLTGKERMKIEIFSDTSWTKVKEYRSSGNIDWESQHINVTIHSRSKYFKLRFVASGENSNNIVS